MLLFKDRALCYWNLLAKLFMLGDLIDSSDSKSLPSDSTLPPLPKWAEWTECIDVVLCSPSFTPDYYDT